MVRTAGELAALLAALPVRVSSVDVVASTVPVDDYPGGRRPTSVVRVSDGNHSGFGENVAFATEEHDRFAARAPDISEDLRVAGTCVGALPRIDGPGPGPGYERAALEAALLDLAMRQAGLTFAGLTGAPREARLRFVVSFSATSDPVAHVRRLRAAGYGGALKIDVDPSWDEATRTALATEAAGAIAILDFKGRGDVALARRWAALVPQAILEDPPPGTEHARVARDAPLPDANAVAAARARGEFVNLKAPRMGGPLEVLRGLDGAAPRDGIGIHAYLGGMFEVGPGRAQARQLAALFCGDSPNDLAPVTGSWTERFGGAPPELLVRLDTPGFG